MKNIKINILDQSKKERDIKMFFTISHLKNVL